MTPHKYSGDGTYVVDRRFRHIGRVHRASGIKREDSFKLFNAALTDMAGEAAGREWIRAFQRGDVDGVELWGIYKSGRWRQAPDLQVREPLVTSVESWRERMRPRVSDDTYRVRRELVTRLAAAALALGLRDASIQEAPAVLRRMRDDMAATPASFNLLRNYFRAYLRDTLGKRHELYQTLKYDILPIPIPGHAKKKERKRHPLTPAQVQLLASKFSTTKAGGGEGAEGHGYVAIGMALTGMHPKEYWGAWDQAPTYVHVHGTKREQRDRMVPKLFPSPLWPHAVLKRPTVTRLSFARAFRRAARAAGLTCSPLDLRRSFADWMEQAGVERSHRRIYRGHGPKDIGDHYETPEILQHLEQDGAKLRSWIAQQLAVAEQLRLHVEGGATLRRRAHRSEEA